MITFNKPFLAGNELNYIKQSIYQKKISGNGIFTNKCQDYFQTNYHFNRCLLTSSCTDALEMAAILCDIKIGDEVIVPSYTFVSTANAFVLRGAKIVFADSRSDHPGIDERTIESLITSKTKVIVPVHYGGISCDMEIIMNVAKKYDLFVVEDAAQAIDSYYKDIPLGSIGHMGCFSFHETKNIICGEGGMLVVNDNNLVKRSEIIWEKGTNRAEFFRGETNKYGWVDIGSSFLPSEITAAFLYAQLEKLEIIQKKRKTIWQNYFDGLFILQEKRLVRLPNKPTFASLNGHLFYLITKNLKERSSLINFLNARGIQAVFHYLPLHKSQFYHLKHDNRLLKNAIKYANCLVRLPFYYDLSIEDQNLVISCILEFYKLN
jgi:dTDP-4-amino-4,6-dideoxygalactose transaminase